MVTLQTCQSNRARWPRLSKLVGFIVVGVALACTIYVHQNHIVRLKRTPMTPTQITSTNDTWYLCWTPGLSTTRKEQCHEVKVLVWTPIHSKWQLYLGQDNVTNFECTGCTNGFYITNDRRTLTKSDVVLFHGKDINVTDMPLWRSPDQKWVYWSMEPPSYPYAHSLKQLNGTFNWTMTYRLDSDVVTSYGKMIKYKMSQHYDFERLRKAWKQKSKMAVWVVSNCMTPSKREHYGRELRRHVTVDVYGFCGNNNCPISSSYACYQAFSRVYFFYLSFENSVCKDYVTEKLFEALKYDIIPVVFGGGNYSLVAPAGSYIDALSFASPKELADHMKQVASNFSLYAEYFYWKRTHNVTTKHWIIESFCSLCRKVHSTSLKEKTVSLDPFHWWVTMSQCREWKM